MKTFMLCPCQQLSLGAGEVLFHNSLHRLEAGQWAVLSQKMDRICKFYNKSQVVSMSALVWFLGC